MKHPILTLLLAMTLLSGCSAQSTAEPAPVEQTPAVVETPEEPTTLDEVPTAQAVDVSVMGMTGPTTMGMVSMMYENEQGNLSDNNYTFTMAGAIDEVTPQIVSGGVDIAAVPANIASVLYNNSDGAIQVIAINTLGVLYIVESGDTITTMEDLAGKTIYASGKGGTTEYALSYILAANGLTDSVTIEWKSEQAEVVAALAATENAIAMLPQPFVTTAQMSNDTLRVALDLTAEWNATDSDGMLITGVTVVNTAYAQEHPQAVDAFLAHYADSIAYVNENLAESAALVGYYGIVSEAVALQALPYCSITYMDGAEMETALTGYLSELYAQNPAAIGGAMPDDAFFYGS